MRRKFFEARERDPVVARWILRQIGALYRIEHELREQRAGPALRTAVRTAQSAMIIARIKQALWLLKPRYLPQSAFGKAIAYAFEQWPALLRFLDNGRLEIGRVGNRRGGRRSRSRSWPAAFALLPVPHALP